MENKESKVAKKIFGLLIVIILLSSVFGCQPAQPATQAPQQAQPTSAPAEPTKAPEATKAPEPTATLQPTAEAQTQPQAPAETVELQYYIMGTDPTSRPQVQEAIDKYLEPMGIKVNFHFIGWGDWAGKAITAMEAGEKIDVFFVADWYFYSQLANEGLLTPLNDPNGANGNLLEKYGKDITASLNPAFITGSQIDGVNYAVPTNKELSVPWGFVYNATMADEIGFTDAEAAKVQTMKDLEPWLEKAKKAHPDIYPYNTDGSMGFMQWVHGFSPVSDFVVNMKDRPDETGKWDETIMVPFETDWMKDYLKTVRSWYTKGYINPDAGLTTYDPSPVMNAGKFFIQPMPLKGSNIKAQELVIASGNPDLKLKEVYGEPKTVQTNDTGGSMLAIPTSSDHSVQAMQLINLMHKDSNLLNMMLFGVPDTMWKKDADGRVNIIDDSWLKAHPGAWVWGDVLLQSVTNKEDPNKNQMLIDYSKDALPHPSLGFRFKQEPVTAELTAINTAVGAGQRALLTGYVDPDVELPKFLKSLKDAGLDKYLAEVQKQYAEWKAKKGQ